MSSVMPSRSSASRRYFRWRSNRTSGSVVAAATCAARSARTASRAWAASAGSYRGMGNWKTYLSKSRGLCSPRLHRSDGHGQGAGVQDRSEVPGLMHCFRSTPCRTPNELLRMRVGRQGKLQGNASRDSTPRGWPYLLPPRARPTVPFTGLAAARRGCRRTARCSLPCELSRRRRGLPIQFPGRPLSDQRCV
jgi:hypothetical protein